jgi:hypothetical protein
MRVSALCTDPTIQEKHKTTTGGTGTSEPCVVLQVSVLAAMLRSRHFPGEVLRVLVRRLRHPEWPYTDRELRVLLVLTLALQRNGMWK